MPDDEVLEIEASLDSLRVHEIEAIEEITGLPIDEAFAHGKPRGKAMRALGYVVRKRDNPDFTIEDAGNLIVHLGESSADPTAAAD